MALIRIGDENVDWNQLGLPEQPFRIYVHGGLAEYRPVAINGQNQIIRARMMTMLSTSPLSGNLAQMNQTTSASGRIEHAAYIFADGSLSMLPAGSQEHAPTGTPPAGSVVGYVHTHPVPSGVMAPPSANDYAELSFQSLPIQLVSEMGGRVWALFAAGYCSLLGLLTTAGVFQPVTDTSRTLVYQTVSSDQLRMDNYDSDHAREAAARQRQVDAMHALAEQRRRDAEARRAGN